MMARRKSAAGYFFVYTMSYINEMVKQRIEAGGEPAQLGEIKVSAHMSTAETAAGMLFYRACKAARQNPLAFEVSIEAGQQVVADVLIKH